MPGVTDETGGVPPPLSAGNRRYLEYLSSLDDFSAGIRALDRLTQPRAVKGRTVKKPRVGRSDPFDALRYVHDGRAGSGRAWTDGGRVAAGRVGQVSDRDDQVLVTASPTWSPMLTFVRATISLLVSRRDRSAQSPRPSSTPSSMRPRSPPARRCPVRRADRLVDWPPTHRLPCIATTLE